MTARLPGTLPDNPYRQPAWPHGTHDTPPADRTALSRLHRPLYDPPQRRVWHHDKVDRV